MMMKKMIMAALMASLIAVGAFIRIPTPLTYITLQTFFVLLTGGLLGPKWGSLSVLLYLIIGLIGIPVFALGGGFSYVLQPSFGYLLGFLLGAFIMGMMTKKGGLIRFFLASVLSVTTIYIIGAGYLYLISRFYLDKYLGFHYLIVYGILLFLPGDLFSSLVACLVLKRVKPIIENKTEL